MVLTWCNHPHISCSKDSAGHKQTHLRQDQSTNPDAFVCAQNIKCNQRRHVGLCTNKGQQFDFEQFDMQPVFNITGYTKYMYYRKLENINCLAICNILMTLHTK